MKNKYILAIVIVSSLAIVILPYTSALVWNDGNWSRELYDDASINRNETYWSVWGSKGITYNASQTRYISLATDLVTYAGGRRINASNNTHTIVGVNFTNATKALAKNTGHWCGICVGNGTINGYKPNAGYCWQFGDNNNEAFITIIENGFETKNTQCANQDNRFSKISMEFYYNYTSGLLVTNQDGALCNVTNTTWAAESSWFYSVGCARSGTNDADTLYFDETYDIVLYNPAAPPPPITPVSINDSTYNVTTGYSDTIQWRDSRSYPIGHTNDTPEVHFFLNGTKIGNCSIGNSNLNYSDMTDADANTQCQNLESNEHYCQLPSSQSTEEGVDLLYISCKRDNAEENTSSSSGPLTIGFPYIDYSFGKGIESTSNTKLNFTFYYNTTTYNPVVFFEYNNSQYNTNRVNFSDKAAHYNTELTIPLVSPGENNENKTFYWNITTFERITNETNQSVFRFNVTNCTVPVVTETTNFTLLNEEDNSDVVGDLASVWTFWSNEGDGSVTRSFTNSMFNQKNFTFCLYPNWVNLTANIDLYYEADGFPSRESHYLGRNLDNVSENTDLFLLDSGNSTTFQITVMDVSYKTYNGVTVGVLRYNPATDSYDEVESALTNDLGQALVHLVLEEVWYRFMITDTDGITILHTTGRTKAYCPQTNAFDQCLMNIVIPLPEDTQTYIWDDISGLSYSVGFNNNTNISSLTYSFDASVMQYIRFINEGVCDQNSTVVAGIFNCDLSGESGTIRREIRVLLVETEEELIIFTDYIDMQEAWEVYGSTGLFFMILILMTIGVAAIATGSPIAAIILVVAMLGAGTVIGISGFTIGSFVLFAVAAAFIIFKMKQ